VPSGGIMICRLVVCVESSRGLDGEVVKGRLECGLDVVE
jgi:hypothetical protein